MPAATWPSTGRGGGASATAGILLGWVGLVAAVILAVLLVATPAALDQRLGEVERIARDFLDGRSALTTD